MTGGCSSQYAGTRPQFTLIQNSSLNFISERELPTPIFFDPNVALPILTDPNILS